MNDKNIQLEQSDSEIQEVVKKAQTGDPFAFSQLYENFFLRIYRYTFMKTGNSEDAEDLTQEVFLKVIRSISKYKEKETPFASWLFRIARNTIIDYVRKRQKYTSNLPLEGLNELIANVDVENSVITSINIEEIKNHMKNLTELQNEVITLRFFGQLSLEETSKVISRNVNATKNIQYSALTALRKQMNRLYQ